MVGGFSVNFPAGLAKAQDILQRELEKQQIRRELEKEEIRREIIAAEMARRRELEEEVRREMASERPLGIPMQRGEGFQVPHRFSMPLNIFSGPKPQLHSPPQDYTPTTQTNKDKLIILPRPKVVVQGAKRPMLTPPATDEGEHPSLNLRKKPKHQFSCSLCQISTTSEKGLNDHFQGRKHRAKEVSLKPKIGESTKLLLSLKKSKKVCNLLKHFYHEFRFGRKTRNQIMQPSIKLANTSILE
uniref:C2H2-type domain-containing protein n=1 Tax=Cajanus cajan TaxID=3821 RepID=A0A151S9G4_CAJCA|nr:hypothetical protein KK1_026753 [Cajanus cajan]